MLTVLEMQNRLINHHRRKSRESSNTFCLKTITKTFASGPRPRTRLIFVLETKTLSSRTLLVRLVTCVKRRDRSNLQSAPSFRLKKCRQLVADLPHIYEPGWKRVWDQVCDHGFVMEFDPNRSFRRHASPVSRLRWYWQAKPSKQNMHQSNNPQTNFSIRISTLSLDMILREPTTFFAISDCLICAALWNFTNQVQPWVYNLRCPVNPRVGSGRVGSQKRTQRQLWI